MTKRSAQGRAELELEPVGESVSLARRYVRERLGELGREDLEECAELGVSELVTNSALHARSLITVHVDLTPEGNVRVEVSDGSSLMPVLRRHVRTATTGRGLQLLGSCGTWGAHDRSDGRPGKTVWFEPAPTMAAMEFSLDAVGED